jgi:hypothetical protein
MQPALKPFAHSLLSDLENIWEPLIKTLILTKYHLHQCFCAQEAQYHAVALEAGTDKQAFLIRNFADKWKTVWGVS